jgi:hypothetical protein
MNQLKLATALMMFPIITFSSTTLEKTLTENITYVGFNTNTPRINTELTANSGSNKEQEVEFETNTSGVYTFSIGTTYIDLSVSTPLSKKKDGDDNAIEESRYSDLYFKGQFGDFEFTYHNAKYDGGTISEESESDIFHEDYTVNKSNLRLSYYTDTKFNKILKSPIEAIIQRTNLNSSYFDSWIVTLGYDKTATNFPQLSDTETNDIFNLTASSISYIDKLESKTKYYSFGYAGLHMLTENFTYNFKISFGNGIQESKYTIDSNERRHGGSSRYIEFDFATNYLFNKTHNIGIKTESYRHTTELEGNTISSRASQTSLFYQYLL